MTGTVVVVGSLSVDFVMRVPRRPQKGETIAGFDFHTFVGGKGNNQAIAAARAGATVQIVGKVGADSYGESITAKLEENSVGIEYLFTTKTAGTGIANIYVDPEGDNSIVIVPQANAQLSAEDVQTARPAILDAKVVLIQLEIPYDTVLAAASAGQLGNAIVILNPAPAPPAGSLPEGLLASVDLLTPNQTEAELLTGILITDRESATAAALQLQKAGAAQVIITMGSEGALYLNSNGIAEMIPTYSVEVVDSTAAGDAFCGTLAAALANEIPMERAIRMACAGGALACTISGAEPSLPRMSKIEALMSGEGISS